MSEQVIVTNEIACKSCGALVHFKPGTRLLTCSYCQAENEIAPSDNTAIIELDLAEYLAKQDDEKDRIEVVTLKCESCGASSSVDPNIASDKCPFCGTTFVIKNGSASALYKPQYLLPFGIDDKKALENFQKWLKGLWFAPSALANYVDRADRLSGMYLPYWTFDCQTTTDYTGSRGEDYTTTESYTDSKGNSQTRTVTRTNWYPASGTVSNSFDDILIEATKSVPQDMLRTLEPWDLKNVEPYNEQYLRGFRTETFQVDLSSAYEMSKQRMTPVIRQAIQRDISGDRQTISSMTTTYTKPTFKYILLPVWISAYKYDNKVYQFLVNARTGEVQGARPYSAIKIALAVIGGLIAAGIIYYLSQ